MKVSGIAFIVYFLLQWSFLNAKIPSYFRDKFDVLYAYRAKRCNVFSSAVLLICIHSEIKKYRFFILFLIHKHDVIWTNIEFWQQSGIYWHYLSIFLNETNTVVVQFR